MTISTRTRAALRALPTADLRAMLSGVRARVDMAAANAPRDASRSTSRVTPLVAARARALDVDTATLTGTGVGGRVTTEDVDQAADNALYARLFG